MTALSTATRSLARHPAHSALIVAVFAASATLALALFTVLDAFLWHDPGFPAPESVVQLFPVRDGKRQPAPILSGTALFLRENTTSFTAFAISRSESAALDLGHAPAAACAAPAWRAARTDPALCLRSE